MMNNYLAQVKLAPDGGFRGFGPLGLEGKSGLTDSILVFNNVLSTAIGVMTIVAFIWFVIQFFLGAIGIIFSGGDKSKIEQAKSKISTSLIGVVVVIAATALLGLVGEILGINLLGGGLLIFLLD